MKQGTDARTPKFSWPKFGEKIECQYDRHTFMYHNAEIAARRCSGACVNHRNQAFDTNASTRACVAVCRKLLLRAA